MSTQSGNAKAQGKETWGLDFDGTVSFYEKWVPGELGEPIPEMVRKVKEALADGVQIVIFTARVYPGESYERALEATQHVIQIAQWCQDVFGEVFPITCQKFPFFTKIIDDRAVQVLENSGVYLSELIDGDLYR